MDIIYASGSFLDGPETIAIHGCNAQGHMGRGAALTVRQQCPFAYEAYRAAFAPGKVPPSLGDVIWGSRVGDGKPLWIGNAITQDQYGPGNRQYVDYGAITQAIREVDHFIAAAQDNWRIPGMQWSSVAMPKIGAGLGGGNWDKIAAIITRESRHFQPVVYVL